MIFNALTASLPDSLVAQIVAWLNQCTTALPFLMNLTPEERRKLPSVSDNRLPYVLKVEEYCKTHRAKIGMSQENLNELLYYAKLFKDLTTLLRLLEDLERGVRDTQMQAGAILYRQSRIGHGQIKLAYLQGKPGVEAMLDNLDKLFEGQGNPNGDANDNGNGSDAPTDNPTDTNGGPAA
jgi:hypothetical protein